MIRRFRWALKELIKENDKLVLGTSVFGFYDSSWGFPNDQIIQIYRQYGAKLSYDKKNH